MCVRVCVSVHHLFPFREPSALYCSLVDAAVAAETTFIRLYTFFHIFAFHSLAHTLLDSLAVCCLPALISLYIFFFFRSGFPFGHKCV